MKNLLSLVLIACLFQFSFAQKTGKISGKFIDETTQNGVPFVNVVLLNPKDSIQIKGISSDIEGKFAIDKIPFGKYLISASMIGYEKYFSDILNVTSENANLNLKEIKLNASAINLDGVEIVAKKPFIEQEAGRITVNVESDPSGTGDNVFELLRKVPGVTVENDETIKLNGKSGVLILIDNKPTYLSGDALILMLKNMQTSSVDKIEAITDPSAKYDAEGVSGILNIRMKRNRNLGINGSVYASGGYSNIFRHSEGADLTARFKNLTVFGSIGNNSYPSKSDSKSEIIYPNGIAFETNTDDDERWLSKYKSSGQNYRFGADYSFNNKNMVGVNFRLSSSDREGESSSFTRIKKNDIIDSSYKSITKSPSDYDNLVFSANYRHLFDSLGTEINIDLDYSNNKSPRTSNDLTQYYHGDFDVLDREERIINTTDFSTEIISAKVDFEKKLSKIFRFEAGVKASFVSTDNNLKSEINGNLNTDRSNHFTFNENIYAAYSSVNATFSQKAGLRLGLRAEYTDNEGLLEDSQEINSQNYFSLFPNVNFFYQIVENQNLNFSYRYRIQRPGYSMLNPFRYKNSNYSYRQGNPDLEPQYAHSASISHSFKHMIFTSINYTYVTDQYTYLDYYDNTSLINTSIPQNIGKTHQAGLSVNGNIPIAKWWNLSGYISGNFSSSTFNYVDSTVNTNNFSSYIWLGNYFTITSNLTAEISGWGMPRTSDYFSKQKARVSVNVGIKQMLFDKKMTIRFSVQDVFGSMNWKSENIYPNGTITKGESRWGSRSFWLSLSYRFGKQDIKLRQRKSSSDEEQGRIGG